MLGGFTGGQSVLLTHIKGKRAALVLSLGSLVMSGAWVAPAHADRPNQACWNDCLADGRSYADCRLGCDGDTGGGSDDPSGGAQGSIPLPIPGTPCDGAFFEDGYEHCG